MRKSIFYFLSAFTFLSCNAQPSSNPDEINIRFTLTDFYSQNEELDKQVNFVFENLSEEERVAQMIIASLGKLGKPYQEVLPLVKNRKIGGVIFLSGNPDAFQKRIDSLQKMDDSWPLLMSMDAEPSLFNGRMPGTPKMSKTAELKTEQAASEAAQVIDKTLHEVGFQQNFAPVIDLSAENVAIGNRTFGSDSSTVVPLAKAFIEATQRDQIIATAKHFPGHGRVSGDTHKKLVFIDGEMTEVNLYKPIIEAGVLSIMVGHIAIENNERYNTNGAPSTLSKPIVTDLLRKEMGFEGLIITDAMNMGAVNAIEKCGVKAALAGCDMVLMPVDELGTLEGILTEMEANEEVKNQINASVKRIIRAKLCLGMSF